MDGSDDISQYNVDSSFESARKQELTESELLFEKYLTVHGYTDFSRVPEGNAFRRFAELAKKPEDWQLLTPNDAAEIARYLISASSEVERADGAKVPRRHRPTKAN